MSLTALPIPNSATIKGARGFLQHIDWTLEADGDATVLFHPKWCHMQPWILAALGAWGLEAQKRGMSVDCENDDRALYAWRFGLTPMLGRKLLKSLEEHEEAGRFVPLKQVRDTSDLQALIADIGPLLHLSDEPEQAMAIQYVVSEMVRNVLEHSGSSQGAVVAAQYYRGDKTERRYVSIGVADCGQGVRSTISRNYPDVASDRDAVLKAIQPGTTGAFGALYGATENGGVGLFVTRNLAAASGGYFALVSGDAMFRTSLAKRPAADDMLVYPISRYPGTIVCVEIGLDESIEITEFLEQTRSQYGDVAEATLRKARKKVRFS